MTERRFATALLALGFAGLDPLGPAASLSAQNVAPEGYRIEVAAPLSLEAARQISERLEGIVGDRLSIYVDLDPPLYEVRLGDFLTRESGQLELEAIRAAGFPRARVVATRVSPEATERVAAASSEQPAASAGAGPPTPGPGQVDSVPPASVASGLLANLAVTAPAEGPEAPNVAADSPTSGQDPGVGPSGDVRVTGADTPAEGPAAETDPPAALPAPAPDPAGVHAASGADRLVREPAPVAASPPVEPDAAAEPSPASPGEHPGGAVPAAEFAEIVSLEQEPAELRYEGYHGITNCQVTFGWVWIPDRPEDAVRLDLYDGPRLIATVTADADRKDLRDVGKGTGRYGFEYRYPDSVPAPAMIEARVSGTGVRLRGTPRPNPCVAQAQAEPAPDGATSAGGDGGGSAPADDGAVRKSIRTARVGADSMRVDGVLDEPVWARAEFRSDFRQKGLDRGFDRPRQTMVAFAYDEDALYVAARMESQRMTRVDTRVDRRDEGGNADRILVSLDTFRDRRTAYTFGVTATGVRLDHYHPQDQQYPVDDSFDPVWDARTQIDANGWTAEMRIPFSQLRFNPGAEMTWGVNVHRWSPQEYLDLYWVVVPMAESGWASRFGELTGLEDVGSGLRVEAAPYALAGLNVPLGSDSPVERASTSRFGGDLKVGLGSQLTLDATVNPDFGQVEADPAEVNLTAFESTFQERRPFFVEGSQLFRPRGPIYFYSRRIGSVPNPGVPRFFEDLPDATTIRGAAKLTGRLGSGTSVGGLFARTDAAFAEVFNPNTEVVDQVPAAPSASYAVARVLQEFGAPGSSFGLMVTGVKRDFDAGSRLDELLVERAIAGGADWNVRFRDGIYQLSGHVGGSLVRGDSLAMRIIQGSSAHYFQRPDATHVELDPGSTSLSGYTAGLQLEKLTGRHWWFTVGGNVESPGFDIRDAGTLRAADDIDIFGDLRYRQVRPNPLFRHYWLSASASASWNFEGVRQFLSPSVFFHGTLPNFWRAQVRASYEVASLSDDLTRGGPLMSTPEAWEWGAGLLAPFNATTQWSLNGSYRSDSFDGWSWNVDGGFSFRPSTRLGLSIYPGYRRGLDTRQYWGAWPDGRDETFGSRYVFASLDREEVYAQLSAELAVTPDFGIEVHAEPFVATGHFFDFGELVAPRTGDLLVYGRDGSNLTVFDDGSLFAEDPLGSVYIRFPDYNVRSFRSNTVLRWEWLPGSTLFVIWQQNRWYQDSFGEPARPGTLWRALGDSGEDIFMAKLTYRLGVR